MLSQDHLEVDLPKQVLGHQHQQEQLKVTELVPMGTSLMVEGSVGLVSV